MATAVPLWPIREKRLDRDTRVSFDTNYSTEGNPVPWGEPGVCKLTTLVNKLSLLGWELMLNNLYQKTYLCLYQPLLSYWPQRHRRSQNLNSWQQQKHSSSALKHRPSYEKVHKGKLETKVVLLNNIFYNIFPYL